MIEFFLWLALWILCGLEFFILVLRLEDKKEMHEYSKKDWGTFFQIGLCGFAGILVVSILFFIDFIKERDLGVGNFFKKVGKSLIKPIKRVE